MRISKYLVTASLLVLSAAVASAEETQLRDLTVEQAPLAQIIAPHPGSLRTTIVADRPDAIYAVGEFVHLTAVSSEDAFVTVLDVGPSGQATQLFPNRFQPDNHVFANRPVEIAGGFTGAQIMVQPPTGTELIKVITSTRPITHRARYAILARRRTIPEHRRRRQGSDARSPGRRRWATAGGHADRIQQLRALHGSLPPRRRRRRSSMRRRRRRSPTRPAADRSAPAGLTSRFPPISRSRCSWRRTRRATGSAKRSRSP